MKSVGEARRRLPSEYVQRLYDFFPVLVADQILQGCTSPRLTTIRINPLKTNIRNVIQTLQANNIKFERVLWYDDALIIKNCREKRLEKLAIYQEGEIYLQSLSSMIPPLILNPNPNEHVLDLTAAPGSKTTQLAAMMKNKGQIIAVEINEIRFQRLLSNTKLQAANNVKAIQTDGIKIGQHFPKKFDKVLLDAPCSGEGLFIASNSKTYRFWRKNQINQLRKLQRKLLDSAILATKQGGLILYSTCTLNPEENELIINQALDRYQNQLQIKKIPIKMPRFHKGLTNFANTQLSKSLESSIRIIPNHQFEGFYCCLLKKL